ncbi:MAG: hypothetical protein ACR2LF_04705 [Jatrophihabitantaceae bacterium]
MPFVASSPRRSHAKPTAPHDLDLMVVGSGDVGEIRAAAEGAKRTLGRDVNVAVLRLAERGRGKYRSFTDIKSEPLVELNLAG